MIAGLACGLEDTAFSVKRAHGIASSRGINGRGGRETDADSNHVEDHLHYKGNCGTGEHGTPRSLVQHDRADVVSGSNCTHLGRFSVLVWASIAGE
jgi:hypothetical protein